MLEDNANQKLHVKERLWRQPLWAISKCLLTLSMLHRHTVFFLATIEVSMQLFPWMWKKKRHYNCYCLCWVSNDSNVYANFHYCYEFPLSLSKERKMNLKKKKKLIMINLLLPTHQRLCDLHCCEFFDVIVPKKKNYNY